MLLGSTCAGCDRPGPPLCPPCTAGLQPAPTGATPPGLDACAALLRYEGVARRAVLGLKYGHHRAALDGWADGLAALVAGGLDPPDLVTWAPTSAERRRRRGFDQARLLARAVARRIGRPARPVLIRLPGPAQTGRSAAERLAGPHFTARGPVAGRVLVVDDVLTTGATMTAAAAALRQAGAGAVDGLVLARTPSPNVAGFLKISTAGADNQSGRRATPEG